MFRSARRILAVSTLFVVTSMPGRVVGWTDASVVTNQPSITFVGGTAARRETFLVAVDRYVDSGLSLPDLEVHIHEDRSGCRDMQGMFRPAGDIGLIDICYGGEFLALHELGHAWEHFNLDADAREHFAQVVGATTWRSTEVVWRQRGAEITANTLAHGLLSAPLKSADQRALELERFETLTGRVSPRLAELAPAVDVGSALSATERSRLAAYAAWRASGTDA